MIRASFCGIIPGRLTPRERLRSLGLPASPDQRCLSTESRKLTTRWARKGSSYYNPNHSERTSVPASIHRHCRVMFKRLSDFIGAHRIGTCVVGISVIIITVLCVDYLAPLHAPPA